MTQIWHLSIKQSCVKNEMSEPVYVIHARLKIQSHYVYSNTPKENEFGSLVCQMTLKFRVNLKPGTLF